MSRGKPVVMVRPDGTEVKYATGAEAARGEGMVQAVVSEMCRGLKKQYKGYTARFDSAGIGSVEPTKTPGFGTDTVNG